MSHRYLRDTAVAALVCLFAPSFSGAQSPWQVTITPTLNPLPIGLCGAVHLTVKNAAGSDIPRNGLGARISIADFDMAVTAQGTRSVAGLQIDASHWSACACTGATVGAVATVTASYPAQSLPAAARVPGAAFKTTATFVIAPAKGTNPPACVAPPSAASASKPVSAPATPADRPATVTAPASPAAPPASVMAPSLPANAKPSSAPQQQQQQQQQQQPAIPIQIPEFPDSTADWAAMQESLGSKGWAELQKALDEYLEESPDPEEYKPPPEVANMLGAGRNHAQAVAAFKRMLPVLRHARCVNCHMRVTYFDQIEKHGGEKATHKGGDINELPMTARDAYGSQDVKFSPCKDCHTKAPPAWDLSGPEWTGLDDFQMCQEMKRAAFNGVNLIGHLREDDLVKLAFEGRKAMEDVTPEPPPLTHSEFLRATTEWVNRMDAMKQWPKARSEGCPRTDAWSGAIEYTFTEAGKLSKFESHGAVHIVGGRAKWSALAARQEDHSAKNCRDVFTGSASGDGVMQLVTIDHTSENPVTGFKMPAPGARPPADAEAPTAFVGLTIFPGKYSLAIDLPMEGSGSNQGGGSACPGYKPYVREFDSKISETANGKFDPDNPDELSGTTTYSPFPGASITLKWQFMRLNSDRGP